MSKLRPASPAHVANVRAAVAHLRAARDLLSEADCPKAAARARLALTSAGGAERHALRRAVRAHGAGLLRRAEGDPLLRVLSSLEADPAAAVQFAFATLRALYRGPDPEGDWNRDRTWAPETVEEVAAAARDHVPEAVRLIDVLTCADDGAEVRN